MAYGDIVDVQDKHHATYREKNGVITVSRAAVLKNGHVNHLDNEKNLSQLTTVTAYDNAGLYIGTTGNVCVLLSQQSDIIVSGTNSSGNTTLLDDTKSFTTQNDRTDFIQKLDVVLNTTANTAFFVKAVLAATSIQCMNASFSTDSTAFSGTSQNYEVYRATLFENVPAGTFLPFSVDRVFAFATTADEIVAVY
tara:strand:- start:419 stop:1000 length:582 start_codon:yes stop_codon:yes gene_type:complete